jgi:hypothetical protein
MRRRRVRDLVPHVAAYEVSVSQAARVGTAWRFAVGWHGERQPGYQTPAVPPRFTPLPRPMLDGCGGSDAGAFICTRLRGAQS